MRTGGNSLFQCAQRGAIHYRQQLWLSAQHDLQKLLVMSVGVAK
jgi:hypothetical protein